MSGFATAVRPAVSRAGDVDELTRTSARISHRIIDMCASSNGGHIGGSLSIVDILVTLYFAVLRIDPQAPQAPGRDRFVLSKGHGAVGLYATLAERGFFPTAELDTFARPGSRLMAHPVTAVPGVEVPTGSLGHGLSLGLGMAIGARLDDTSQRVFVLLGDGELQEGSVWEAAMSAAATRAGNLVAIVDRNRLQLTGDTESICPLEPLGDRWRAMGWLVHEIEGHDFDALRTVLSLPSAPLGTPTVVIARTVKGHGLPYVAGTVKSHFAALSPAARDRAHRALDGFTGGAR